MSTRNETSPTSVSLAASDVEPARLSPKGFGPSILRARATRVLGAGPLGGTRETRETPILALEEELEAALRSARRLRAAGLVDQADAGLRFAASIVRELCSMTGRWPEVLKEVSA